MNIGKVFLKTTISVSVFLTAVLLSGVTASADEETTNYNVLDTTEILTEGTEESQGCSETEQAEESDISDASDVSESESNELNIEEETEESETIAFSEYELDVALSVDLNAETDKTKKDGWQTVDGKRYYYVDGKAVSGMYQIDGIGYFFDDTGVQRTGWVQSNGIFYYYDISDGSIKTGETTIDGVTYLFNMKGQLSLGWRTVGGKRVYYSPETGKPVYGWIEYFDNKYYTDETNGKEKGWLEENNNKYYLSDTSGQMKKGLQKVSDSTYYFNDDGVMQTGLQEIDGDVYGFDDTGKACTGFTKLNNKTYYFDSDGKTSKGFIKIDGSVYYFGTDGVMLTGLQKIESDFYYFDNSGKMNTGFQTVNGKLYYFDDSGKMLKDTFKDDYKIDADGVAVKLTTSQQQAKKVLDEIGWDLKKAFTYSYSMPYYGHTASMPQDSKTGIEWYADYGFTNYKGNCYVMASVFYRLSEMLGYEVKQISGTVPLLAGGSGPHSWVEIVVDGKTYVCDPDFQNETGRDGYLITYGQSGTWRYNKQEEMS